MKNLILILWFVLFLSSSALAGVEYVTEEVCHAMSGCVLDTKTGECPDCVIERRKVVHTHEETPVIVEKPEVPKRLVVKTTPKKKITYPSNKRWVGTLFKCQVGCQYAYWDSAGNNYDEKMNRVYN
jgi:hypothetical protein